MKPPPIFVHLVVLLGVALVSAYAAAAAPPAAASVDRRSELVGLVRQDCGSCHGLTLAGGLGPALLPHALAGKPVESMVATVMGGRPGTAMPGWSRFLSEAEAEWVVRELMRGFPAAGGTR